MNPSLNQEIHDVKPPMELPESFLWPWGVLIILFVLILAGYIFWWLRYKRMSNAAPLKTRTPWEIAHERLSTLEHKGLSNQEQFEAFYVELSSIMRRYMEDQFSLRAPEMTTEEFLNHLQTTSHLNDQQKDIFKDFLNACDMVKFARYGPTEKETQESLKLARTLINETH